MTEKISAQTEEFRNDGILKLILRYSVPSIIGSLMFTTYNVVDRLFISRAMGSAAIAGVGITFHLFMVFIAVGVMFGVGGGTLMSLRLGEGKHEDAEKILGTVFWIFLVGGVGTCILGLIFLKPIIFLFGGSEVTYPYAREYLGILLWFMVFDFISMGTNNILRAEGSPRFSMWSIAAGCFSNIILDYIFIFPLGMGIAGAAWATGISKVISSAMVYWHFRHSRHRTLTLHWKLIRFNWPLTRAMIWIGLSPFILQSIVSVVNALVNNTLGRLGGDNAIAIMTVNSTVLMLMTIPIIGILMGYQPIAGYNYGAKLYKRAEATLRTAMTLGFCITMLLYLPAMFFAKELFGFFSNNDPALLEIGSRSLRIFISGMPCGAIFCIGANFFQSTGRPAITIGINLFRQGVCFIGLLIFLPRFIGLDGVWWSIPIADCISALVTLCFIMRAVPREEEGVRLKEVCCE